MAQGRHSAQGGGPLMTRRGVLACALGALGLAGAAGFGISGCDGDVADGSPAQDSSAGSVSAAHQAAVNDGDTVYYVAFSSGSIVRSDRADSSREVLYTNGQVNHLGVRYLACSDDEVLFCDAPTASILAVGTVGAGAQKRTVWASGSSTRLPLPIVIAQGRLYFSLLESTSMDSELCSVALDGSDLVTHFALPEGFYARYVDVGAGRVYCSGVSLDDVRQIRSVTLEGADELVVFSLDGVASEKSALSWQVADGHVYVEAQDDVALTNRLVSVAADGTDEQLVHDFSSQKVVFDRSGDDLFFVDRETFAVLVNTGTQKDGTPSIEALATVPRRTSATALAFVEAGDEIVWVTTVTPGADSANEYVTYQVTREDAAVVELS